jgi:Ni/Co efflux regulator RcnB
MLMPSRSLAACLLTLLFAASVAAQVRPAAAQNASPQQDEKQTQSRSDVDKEDESESETKEDARPRVVDPATVMRRARFIRVHSDSVFISGQEIEDALRKRKEFQAWGMIITRNDADADLIIEVTRKSLTRRFTFIVLDPRTMEVVTSGKTRSVLFGKKISNKVAEKFANRIKVVRPYPPVAGSTP